MAIDEAGGPPLIKLVGDGTDGGKEQAAHALQILAANANNKTAIVAAGGLGPLVQLAAGGKVMAAATLEALALNHPGNKAAIEALGWQL